MNDAFDIENLLKENLLNKRKNPPIGLFQEIDARLLRKKRRRRLFWILFWLGLGTGIYFAGVYFSTMFNTDCDCSTAQKSWRSSEKMVGKPSDSIEPVSQDITNSTGVYAGNKALQNNVNLVDVVQKEINYIPYLENETLRKSDPHESGEQHIEVAQLNDLALFELGGSNKVLVQIELEQKSVEVKSSEGDNQSKNKPESTMNATEQMKDSVSQTASILEPSSKSLSTNTSEQNTSEKEVLPQVQTTIISETKDQDRKYGLIAYGGPSFFDISVFKPYLSSGSLSNRPFKSSGYELGIGSFKRINERWKLNLSVAYNHKRSQFLYDLLVSEEDYFNYYNNDVLISVEQLDQEENCNCFVANDVQMEYEVHTVNLSFGVSYQIAEFNKFNVHGNFNLSTNVFTQFKKNSSSTVNFPSIKTEKFNGLGLKPGFTIDYALTKNTRLTLSPNYTYLFTRNKSSFYARPLQEITVYLGVSLLF